MNPSQLTAAIGANTCCVNFARDWSEMLTKDGKKLPPSQHSPACENYKLEEFKRISIDGTGFVCETVEVSDFISAADHPEEYKIETIQMTRDQFETLKEFGGF